MDKVKKDHRGRKIKPDVKMQIWDKLKAGQEPDKILKEHEVSVSTLKLWKRKVKLGSRLEVFNWAVTTKWELNDE